MSGRSRSIAVFSPSLVAGGAERVVLNLVDGFSTRGLQTDLVLADASGSLLPEIPKSVNLVALGAKGVLAGLIPLARYLRERPPDVLISAQTHANLIAILACRLSRASSQLILSEHTTVSVNFAREPGIKNKMIPVLVRMLYRYCDAVVAVSHGVAADLAGVSQMPASHIRVIYNPILTPDFSEMALQEPAHPWFRDTTRPIVLAVGRLTAAKDYPTLLQSFALVRSSSNARLLILGEGEMRGELEQLVSQLKLQEDVSMPGYDPNPAAAMSRAAAFVLTSAWEGFGSVIVEALACGTPVVATDCPSGPAEILDGGRYGRLVPVRDAPAVARAIIETLAEPPDRDLLKKRARDFTQEAALDQYLELIDAVHMQGVRRRAAA